jgi:hypothetical protein
VETLPDQWCTHPSDPGPEPRELDLALVRLVGVNPEILGSTGRLVGQVPFWNYSTRPLCHLVLGPHHHEHGCGGAIGLGQSFAPDG